MEELPLISIILPVYNGEKYLSEAIDSCLKQTYKNIELIIVNDCSTDNSLEIIRTYQNKDNRVKLIDSKVNNRLPKSLNIGHRKAIGEFLTWTSDDNILKKDCIEILYFNIIKVKSDIVYSNYTVIDEFGLVNYEVNYLGFSGILFGNTVGASFLYKKEVFYRNSGYDDSLFLIEDYDFWLKATIHSSFYRIDKSLYLYRVHNSTLTSSIHDGLARKEKWIKKTTQMYYSFFQSIGVQEVERLSEIFTAIHTKLPFKLESVRNKDVEELSKKFNFNSKTKILELNEILRKKIINHAFEYTKKNKFLVILKFKHFLRISDIRDIFSNYLKNHLK